LLFHTNRSHLNTGEEERDEIITRHEPHLTDNITYVHYLKTFVLNVFANGIDGKRGGEVGGVIVTSIFLRFLI